MKKRLVLLLLGAIVAFTVAGYSETSEIKKDYEQVVTVDVQEYDAPVVIVDQEVSAEVPEGIMLLDVDLPLPLPERSIGSASVINISIEVIRPPPAHSLSDIFYKE